MLKTLLLEANKAAPKQSWPTYDGKELPREEYLTASEVGSCLRKSYFDKKNQAAFFSNGYAERGHAIEHFWADKLRLTKHEIHFMYPHQVSFYDPELGLSATPDGLLRLPSGEWVLFDFKSVDPRTNKSKLPKKKHVYQVTQGMFLVNACLPDYDIRRAFIWYIDASDIWDIVECEIPYSEEMVEEVINRALTLWNADDADELPAEGILNGDCDYCPHHSRCSAFIDIERKMEVAKTGGMGFLELTGDKTDILEQYVDFYYGQKKLEEELERHKDEVKEIVKQAGGQLIINGNKVSYAEYPGKQTVDQEALTAAGIDLDLFRKTGKPYGTLRITPYKGAR